jgi:hypothetical protein
LKVCIGLTVGATADPVAHHPVRRRGLELPEIGGDPLDLRPFRELDHGGSARMTDVRHRNHFLVMSQPTVLLVRATCADLCAALVAEVVAAAAGRIRGIEEAGSAVARVAHRQPR